MLRSRSIGLWCLILILLEGNPTGETTRGIFWRPFSKTQDIDGWASNVYYDPKSGLPFRITSIENSLMNSTSPSYTKSNSGLKRIGYRANRCTCLKNSCECCAGIKLQQFGFNREGCMNFTYDPKRFAIDMKMLMNRKPVYQNTVSARDPPPFCLPLPIPYLPLDIEGCARLYDVHTVGQNLHMCFDFEARIERAAILVLHFDCMNMGLDGFAFLKPGETVPGPIDNFPVTTTTEGQLNPDVYDPVTEIKYKP